MLGVVENSNAEYRAGAGTSVSDLKVIVHKSPSHLREMRLNPLQPTPAQRLGTAVHCHLLEREEFASRYAVCPPEIGLSTKYGRQFVEEVAAEGRLVLTTDEADRVVAMSRKLLDNPHVRKLLAMEHRVETAIYWRDAATGVLCKARPDLMIEPCHTFPHGLIFDLKTALDASESGFSRAAHKYGYHMQAAWYADGYQQVYGTAAAPIFVFGAVESEAPFEPKLWVANRGGDSEGDVSELMRLGRAECRRALEIYAECERTGRWPGYSTELQQLPLPPWGIRQLNEEDDDGDGEIDVAYVE